MMNLQTLIYSARSRLSGKALHRWLPSYAMGAFNRHAPRAGEPVHVLLCIADHFEPQWGGANARTARQRVEAWSQEYPRLFERFRDADGRPPQHSFFFPIDEYQADHVDAMAALCSRGFGEVEIHLHHDNDTADNLRQTLRHFVDVFANRHRLLARDRQGRPRYAFVHGNWALANSLPGGGWCGVNDELSVLHETGCYADFTLPSAPSPAQIGKVNAIYYPTGNASCPASHARGVDVGMGPARHDKVMMIQGPLVLNWRDRSRGVFPRIENACIQASQPPTERRLDLWLRSRVQVPSRPDWYFVKLHTHGATEANRRVLLAEPMVQFHEALAARAARNPLFEFHYVTAREMYNLARAAEAGWTGSVAEARDFELTTANRPTASQAA